MEKVREEIAAIDKKLKEVPKLEFRDARGELLPEEEADEERAATYESKLLFDKAYLHIDTSFNISSYN